MYKKNTNFATIHERSGKGKRLVWSTIQTKQTVQYLIFVFNYAHTETIIACDGVRFVQKRINGALIYILSHYDFIPLLLNMKSFSPLNLCELVSGRLIKCH